MNDYLSQQTAQKLPSLGLTLKPAEATTYFNLAVAGLVGVGTILLTEGVKDKTAIPLKNIALWTAAFGGLLALAVYNIYKSSV